MSNKSHHRESEESVVSFFDVEDLEVSVANVSQNGEVPVVGKVSSLDVELVEHLMMTDTVGPNLIDVGVFEAVQVVVVLVEFRMQVDPMALHIAVQLNLNVYHFYNKFIIVYYTQICLTAETSP
jgi:hypothetical protein